MIGQLTERSRVHTVESSFMFKTGRGGFQNCPTDLDNTPNPSGTPASESSGPPIMSAPDIVKVLRNPGVPDITGRLKGPDSDPVSFGSTGHLYQAGYDEIKVAIRTIRIFVALNASNQRILEEAATELLGWLQLQHECVVPLLGVACFHGHPAIVSPWMQYGNLRDFRRHQPAFDCLKMCKQVSSAMVYLHDCGVIHGDMKAQNVLVSHEGNAKVTGFGNTVLRELASHYRDGNDFSTLSMRWTAPEVLQGSNRKNRESDIYALGMTILEIFTARVPFAELDSDQKVVLKVMTRGVPSRPQELMSQGRIWGLLNQCWDSNPKARPTAKMVSQALEAMT